MKKSELLKTEHSVQLKWLNNQMAKIANDGAHSFSNVSTAERAYKKMNKALITSDSDLEHFMSVYLSETGLRKLVTTLRVYKKRNNTERLQVEISQTNKHLLNRMVEMSGKTKIEVINLLIENADLREFKKQEEQLELQCNS